MMLPKLSRALAVLDTETTGTNTATDRVIELAVLRLEPDGEEARWCQRFNPGRPIPKEATAVHGISDADLADQPSFAEAVPVITSLLKDADLCGYNARKFDAPILTAEFMRARAPVPWPADKAPPVLDVMDIFRRIVPHTLEGAVRFFLGRDHGTAHTAMGDVEATLEVLKAQMERDPGLPRDMPALLAEMAPKGQENWVDPDGKLIRNEAGEVVLNFSKDNKGKTLRELAGRDRGFLQWILKSDFGPEVKREVSAALARAGSL